MIKPIDSIQAPSFRRYFCVKSKSYQHAFIQYSDGGNYKCAFCGHELKNTECKCHDHKKSIK